MPYLIGIDGGGTRTTLALADGTGRELLRRTGPAGLVDPRRPAATAEMLEGLVKEAFQAAGVEGPAEVLCAGLAGVGSRAEREVVETSLRRSGIARRVLVRSDGETALEGALEGGPGILLIAGTGSIGYGRGEDGRVARCGGWGLIVGDEGSGYAIGRAALARALHAVDGRGPDTRLLPELLEALGLSVPDSIPPWAARAEKSEIAALAVYALRLSATDAVAAEIVRDAARDLAAHAVALHSRLGPGSATAAVVLHGGVAGDPVFTDRMEEALREAGPGLELRTGVADAVTGAVAFARRALESEG
jgi:glucosamine kinase